MDCGYDCNYGKIVSSWTAGDGVLHDYKVVVPANATATLYLPVTGENAVVYENGVPASEAEGVEFVKYDDGMMVYSLGSGSYHFTAEVADNISEVEKDGRMSVYPNPVKDRLNLSCDGNVSKVSLCSVSGSVAKVLDGNCSNIDMTDLAAGVYLLKAWCDDKVYTAKIIKQ